MSDRSHSGTRDTVRNGAGRLAMRGWRSGRARMLLRLCRVTPRRAASSVLSSRSSTSTRFHLSLALRFSVMPLKGMKQSHAQRTFQVVLAFDQREPLITIPQVRRKIHHGLEGLGPTPRSGMLARVHVEQQHPDLTLAGHQCIAPVSQHRVPGRTKSPHSSHSIIPWGARERFERPLSLVDFGAR